jgi:ribosome-binding factor A
MTLHSRQKRINEEIRTQVAEILRDELRDPRLKLGLITVTSVETSNDLRHAEVFVSVLASDEDSKGVMAALDHGAGLVRKLLGEKMTIRHVPSVKFTLDGTARQAARIAHLLNMAQSKSSSQSSSSEISEASSSSPADESPE